jgi:hypothetical protein
MLEKLTEGIRERSLSREGEALVSKWEQTGLLEGLDGDISRNNMSRLLENQAAQLLRESSSMSAGDVEGFAAVAFPIVRRVFGGLLAQDIVSVQPMSLPSGLIFFMDFTTESTRVGNVADESLYGGGRVASQITGGLDLSGVNTEKSFYSLNNGYSSPTGSLALADGGASTIAALSDGEAGDKDATGGLLAAPVAISALTAEQKRALRFDVDLLDDSDQTKEVASVVVKLSVAEMAKVNTRNLIACTLQDDDRSQLSDGGVDLTVMRRLTHLGYVNATGSIVAGSEAQHIQFYTVGAAAADNDHAATLTVVYPLNDAFTAGGGLGALKGTDLWDLEMESSIPEIDIKVDSVAITAVTKKLKAKWSPELAQDLNAYHNLDAEVELTSILSEQIALEIDREILNDLVQGAAEAPLYWSRRPGKFVNRENGGAIAISDGAPDFTGTVSEWYETLLEVVNDLSARIHRKSLRGGANFMVCGPEIAALLEFTSGFRASTVADEDKGTWGAMKAGSLSKKMDIFVDPYFLRNVMLVGRKGSSFLESGYVYAPYVPLQVTPTIFGTEDFVPRKGVMTRYGKKMVQPALYGLVICQDLTG